MVASDPQLLQVAQLVQRFKFLSLLINAYINLVVTNPQDLQFGTTLQPQRRYDLIVGHMKRLQVDTFRQTREFGEQVLIQTQILQLREIFQTLNVDDYAYFD